MNKKACSVLTADIGAGSGKVFAASFDGERIHLRRVYRFSTAPLVVERHLFNDIEAIYRHIITGFQSALAQGAEVPEPLCAAVDTFGNDYVLVHDNGQQMLRPFNYRDTRTLDVLSNTCQEEQLHNYRISGILPAPSMAQYQLFCDAARLNVRERESPGMFLMLPDYFRYRLTNERTSEYTISSTTGMVDVRARDWSESLIDMSHFRRDYFLPLHEPGQLEGIVTDSSLKTSGGGHIHCARVPGHDSACAVIPVPMEADALFLSSGSWFILGMEAAVPYTSDEAFRAGISNQGFLNGRFRVVKPMPGLWIMQKCLDEWRKDKPELDFDSIEQMAANYTGPVPYINVQQPEFSSPGGMLDKIRGYCRATAQELPDTMAGIARSIYAGLALQCKMAVHQLDQLSGIRHNRIYLVGGGAMDSLLAAMIADVTSLMVLAGFPDAAAAGNALMQFVALGSLQDLDQARQVAMNSFSFRRYEPHEDGFWNEIHNKAMKIEERGGYEKLS
jgi:rhamnulokinase